MHFVVFYALALIVLLSVEPASASPLKVVTGNDYAPFADQKLPEGGLATDVVIKVFAHMKEDIQLEWLPWARGYEETRHGTYAATFPYIRRPERELDFLYSDPIYENKDVIFSRPGSGLNGENLSSVIGKRVCIPIGWAIPARLVRLVTSHALIVDRPNDIRFCARMVAAGRTDFFVTDIWQGASTLEIVGLSSNEIVADASVIEKEDLYLIVGKLTPGAKELIKRFNASLKELKEDGSYDKILAKHGS